MEKHKQIAVRISEEENEVAIISYKLVKGKELEVLDIGYYFPGEDWDKLTEKGKQLLRKFKDGI